MITANDIINYAKANGNKIEIETPQSYVRYGLFDHLFDKHNIVPGFGG